MYLFFRIEVAWEPAPPAAPAMATIGPLLQQRRFAEARPLLETLLQLQPEHPEASTTWDSSPAKRAGWRRPGCCCAGRWWPTPAMLTPRPMHR